MVKIDGRDKRKRKKVINVNRSESPLLNPLYFRSIFSFIIVRKDICKESTIVHVCKNMHKKNVFVF